jgi:hypothetical protein
MGNQTVELQRAVLILQLYLSFLENGSSDLNDEDRELVSVLGEHSVIQLATNKSPNKKDYLPL